MAVLLIYFMFFFLCLYIYSAIKCFIKEMWEIIEDLLRPNEGKNTQNRS